MFAAANRATSLPIKADRLLTSAATPKSRLQGVLRLLGLICRWMRILQLGILFEMDCAVGRSKSAGMGRRIGLICMRRIWRFGFGRFCFAERRCAHTMSVRHVP